jgi:Barstar (barnase inhibitor)
MKIIELDAANWTTILDFCDALLASIGAPKWHGASADAFADSMICGGINAVEPPYTVRIRNTRQLPKDFLEKINQVKETVDMVRADCESRGQCAVEVEMEILP